MMNLGLAVIIMVQSPGQREVEILFIQHHLHSNPPTHLYVNIRIRIEAKAKSVTALSVYFLHYYQKTI